MGLLSTARQDIKETLELNGIKAVGYNEDNILAPVAIIVPDEMYILPPANKQKMNQLNVGISVLVVASRGLKDKHADELDDLIEKVVLLLDEFMDIDYVTGPGKVSIKSQDHLGAVIHVQYQIKIGGSN